MKAVEHAASTYRTPLWVGGVMMVVSSLIMAGTSILSIENEAVYGSKEDKSFKGQRLELRSLLSNSLAARKGPQTNDEPGISLGISSLSNDKLAPPDMMPSKDTTTSMIERDLQWHRRLKRIVRPNREREREMKAEQARARATDIKPARKDNFLPPFLQNNFEHEIFVFPDPESEARYSAATKLLEDAGYRDMWDPLGARQNTASAASNINNNATTRVPFEPKVKHLGVLVDAGRHYFPIDWMKRLILYLHRLRFNLIHFRLTDDQAFNVKLKSYPELAYPSVSATFTVNWENGTEEDTIIEGVDGATKKTRRKYHLDMAQNDKIYTPDELRELVAFARSHGITMIPEINLPGHAGSWAGIPDLVLNCPEFVCERGYGIPLNVEHPQLKTILTGVIREVLDIFDNPPFLHLGGDEVFVASKCFSELERDHFNYTKFETLLREVLNEVGVYEDQVLRWEETGLPTLEDVANPKPPRTGNIEHYWLHLPGSKPNQKLRNAPTFVSHGLYMDTNHGSGAEHIYNRTLQDFGIEFGPRFHPMGIVAGAFELGPDFWMQRNVAARLIAVAMGAARLNFTSSEEFWGAYNSTCRDTLGLHPNVCDLQGFVAVSKIRYQRDWKRTWNEWQQGICERLTDPSRQLTMSRIAANSKTTFDEANKYFWNTLKAPVKNRTRILRQDLMLAKAGANHDNQRSATTTGVLLDLVNSMLPVGHTIEILKKYIAPLGIGLVQLRLADNHRFSIDLEHLSRVQYSPLTTYSNPMPKAEDFANLVNAAGELGIEVYPEITLSTNAGGWVQAGYSLNCAQSFCNATSATQRTMANDIGRREFLPVVYSVIRELLDTFSTSRFIHLGSDERRSHAACLQEDGRYHQDQDHTFVSFERKLTKLLRDYMGVDTQHILRWENEEKVHYPGRAGDITHYRSTVPFVLPTVRPGEPFFVTLELLAPPTQPQDDGNPLSIFYEIYKNTRQLMSLKPLGILAEIRNLGEVTWLTHHVGLRLISFSLGARREVEDYSPKEFQEHLEKECRRANFDHCKKLTKNQSESSIIVPKEPLSIFVESDYFVKRLCDKQTVVMVSRKAKDVVH